MGRWGWNPGDLGGNVLLDARPVPRGGLVLRREHDDWAILFDPDTGKGFGLDPVGIFLWEHMDGQRTVGQLVEALREVFAEVPTHVCGDVQDFLGRLVGRGLVDLLP